MLVKLARSKACANVNAKMKSVFCYIYTAVHSRTLDKGGIKSEKIEMKKPTAFTQLYLDTSM